MHAKASKWSIIAALLSLTAAAGAGEIYRYVDADGNVHYVDRPTGAETEQRVAIASRPSDGASARAQMQARYNLNNQNGADESAGEDDAAEPQTRAERQAAARERQQRCEQYRARLETFVTSRRLYREDENGERVYLNDDERQEARDKVQELIEENCD